MEEWIRHSVEYQNWGWNSVTIGSLGTIIFTFVELWGLHKQNQTIWQKQSGQSLSVSWFSFFFFASVAFSFYGLHIRSIASILNGVVLALIHIPILLGLWQYKEFTRWESIQFFLLIATIPAMILLPWKDQVFLIISIGVIYAIATQPLELYKTKSVGAVDIRMLLVYVLSTIFWVIYAFAINEWVLKALALVNLGSLSLATFLWFRYRYYETSIAKGRQRGC